METIVRSIPALNMLPYQQWPDNLRLEFNLRPVSFATAYMHLQIHKPSYVVGCRKHGPLGGWGEARFVRSDEGFPKAADRWYWYLVVRVVPKAKKPLNEMADRAHGPR
jgi:hypothetical protein